jgi:hypothetical protein
MQILRMCKQNQEKVQDILSKEAEQLLTSMRRESTLRVSVEQCTFNIESVTISQDGLEISMSSHILREKQLKKKLKTDRLVYKATALDKSANLSAGQSVKGGSLSSADKVSTNSSDVQAKSGKVQNFLSKEAGQLLTSMRRESTPRAKVKQCTCQSSMQWKHSKMRCEF